MTQNIPNNNRPILQSSRNFIYAILASTLGLIIGWIDLNVTEVSVTIFSLLTVGFLLGLFQPKSAWRWALLIAAGIPIMEIIAIKFALPTAEPVQLDPFVILVVLLFALAGTYLGVLIRKLKHDNAK